MSGPVPGDLELLRPWFPVIRRLRTVAREGGTFGVLSMRVIVDADGVPRHWTMPERISIEPRDDGQDLRKLIDGLSGKAENRA